MEFFKMTKKTSYTNYYIHVDGKSTLLTQSQETEDIHYITFADDNARHIKYWYHVAMNGTCYRQSSNNDCIKMSFVFNGYKGVPEVLQKDHDKAYELLIYKTKAKLFDAISVNGNSPANNSIKSIPVRSNSFSFDTVSSVTNVYPPSASSSVRKRVIITNVSDSNKRRR
ncbi:hypothetical protein TetV_051 [Tetraselmis virus 1]|uniref:Uncharacterized protein n=1 Tax=Tetraselmis virus 1 TaxID=2060617 RepID=A0A2P0VMM9_9VIRU|nr:hypothetical protein QJ968_gp051 [Tetraselmis virus 1]AUF82143.1 hypothetical protein TetV_051 [Tetraselmis virus 1]